VRQAACQDLKKPRDFGNDSAENQEEELRQVGNSEQTVYNRKRIRTIRGNRFRKAPAVATVHDVAAYILRQRGPMSAMKLQKLVYYSQAWSLVWEDRPLFPDRIEAWANGPVVPELYQVHKGQFQVTAWPNGDSEALIAEDRETIDLILDHYGPLNAQNLSDLTHQEDPWNLARVFVGDGDPSNEVISLESMMEYYSRLRTNAQAEG
jgi:uncharacterized phage-associated protein